MRGARSIAALIVASLAMLAVTACGGGARRSSGDAGPGSGIARPTAEVEGTVTMVAPTAPNSLDPQAGDSVESSEATWVTYTGLVSYAHRGGPAGATLIPGLARSLPRIGDGGRTYTVTLRRGLEYSDGRPVRARDFLAALKRAVRLPWVGAARLLDPVVVGAAAFADGRAGTISGVSADDRTGRIVIRLTAADGAFDNVLAEPALGLSPAGGRPSAAGRRGPPPGCGPYMIENVIPGRSYSLVRNPRWKPLPGIPAGKVDVDVEISPDVTADAEAVLNDTADILDWTAMLPARLIGEIESKAPGRFGLVDTGGATDYVFLNQSERPFSSALARRAVVVALDHAGLDRTAGGTIAPACFLLPPAVTGHARGAGCPDGGAGTGDLAQARRLVHRSRTEGDTVYVWSPRSAPAAALMADYTRTLDAIGLHAVPAAVDARDYAGTVGTLVNHPQTGWASLDGVILNPIEIYRRLLDGHAISPQDNENLGEVDDAHLDREIARLSGSAPPSGAAWAGLDEYVARRADVAVIGYRRFPFLASARMDYPALRMSPVYGWDFTSLQLK